jgi:hypothetical protein
MAAAVTSANQPAEHCALEHQGRRQQYSAGNKCAKRQVRPKQKSTEQENRHSLKRGPNGSGGSLNRIMLGPAALTAIASEQNDGKRTGNSADEQRCMEGGAGRLGDIRLHRASQEDHNRTGYKLRHNLAQCENIQKQFS